MTSSLQGRPPTSYNVFNDSSYNQIDEFGDWTFNRLKFFNNEGVRIGTQAGQTNQGTNAIAIGNLAGVTNQIGGSICLNASGVALNPGVTGFFVNPVRNDNSKQTQVQYNNSSKEITYVNQVISPITTSGLDITGNPALLSGSAGGSSGQHLVVVINGVTYKIKLENV
jgi:hypothetical protein